MKNKSRPTLLVLVRHAESVRNEAKKGATYFADEEARRTVKGTPDHLVPLTGRGVSQAEQTGVALRENFGVFDYVYHSAYRRTIETCDGILKAYPNAEREGMKIFDNLFIRERDPGYGYDMTTEEAEANFPWMADYWKTFGGFFARPIGGESLADVVNRVYLFLHMLYRDRAGKKILVITHGGTLRCFRYKLERWSYQQALQWAPGMRPENCGVTTYQFNEQEQRLLLTQYNTVFWKD